MQLASNALFQVNIIGVMTGTEIALERMKKVRELARESSEDALPAAAILWVKQIWALLPSICLRLKSLG